MPIYNPICSDGPGGGGISEDDLLRFLASLMVNDDGAFLRTNEGGFIKAYELEPGISPEVEAFILDSMGQLIVTDAGLFMRSG